MTLNGYDKIKPQAVLFEIALQFHMRKGHAQEKMIKSMEQEFIKMMGENLC